MKTKLAAIWASIKSDMADTWNRSKVFLIAIAALLITLEFQKLKEFLLVYMGKKEVQKNEKKDQQLATEEHTESAQADALIKTAEGLPLQESKVQEGWEKNQ